MEYRERIYRRYATAFQGRPDGLHFDQAFAKAQFRVLRNRYSRWLPQDRAAPVVDLGCGAGDFLYFLKQRGYTDVRGVDVSPQQVRLSRQVSENVEEVGAIEYLRRYRDEFSLITAFDLIEHLTKNEALEFLELAVVALRPGGRLIMQTPNGETPWVGMYRYGDPTHETCYTAGSLEKLMRMCGFEQITCHEAGPIVHGAASALRWGLWKALRLLLLSSNVVETGAAGSGVLTRVFYVVGTKPW